MNGSSEKFNSKLVHHFLFLNFIEKHKKQLKKSELEDYIKKQLEKESIEHLFREFSDRISELSETIKQRCNELEKAELQNKNIPPRAITIMEGNRKAYIHKTMHFTGKIREILSEILIRFQK